MRSFAAIRRARSCPTSRWPACRASTSS